MTSTRTVVIGATAVAAGVAGALALGATGPASARTGTAGHTFTVRVHHGNETNVDLGRSGFSAGDEDLVVARLTRDGRNVGRLVGNCTTVRVARTADQLCEFVLHLAGGQITASGTTRAGQSGPGTFALPILGGTGRYLGADGQLAVTATSGASFPIRVSLR